MPVGCAGWSCIRKARGGWRKQVAGRTDFHALQSPTYTRCAFFLAAIPQRRHAIEGVRYRPVRLLVYVVLQLKLDPCLYIDGSGGPTMNLFTGCVIIRPVLLPRICCQRFLLPRCCFFWEVHAFRRERWFDLSQLAGGTCTAPLVVEVSSNASPTHRKREGVAALGGRKSGQLKGSKYRCADPQRCCPAATVFPAPAPVGLRRRDNTQFIFGPLRCLGRASRSWKRPWMSDSVSDTCVRPVVGRLLKQLRDYAVDCAWKWGAVYWCALHGVLHMGFPAGPALAHAAAMRDSVNQSAARRHRQAVPQALDGFLFATEIYQLALRSNPGMVSMCRMLLLSRVGRGGSGSVIR